MNKFSKTIILCGILLLGLSFIFSAFNFKKIFNPFITDESQYTKETKTISSANIKNLKIDTKNEKITIKPTDNTDIKITYYESEKNKYDFFEENNSFSMKKQNNYRYNIKILNFQVFFPNIVIEVPSTLLLTFNIKTSNSRIFLDNLEILQSNFTTTNGRIDITNITSNEILKFQTSNSSINVENLKARDVYFNTSNGQIKMNNIRANIIEGKSSNGSLNLDRIYSQEIILKTSNGRINLKNIESRIINAATTNSNIEASIIGQEKDYQRDLKTSNGIIRINNMEYAKRVLDNDIKNKLLQLHTSNGSIKIKF